MLRRGEQIHDIEPNFAAAYATGGKAFRPSDECGARKWDRRTWMFLEFGERAFVAAVQTFRDCAEAKLHRMFGPCIVIGKLFEIFGDGVEIFCTQKWGS